MIVDLMQKANSQWFLYNAKTLVYPSCLAHLHAKLVLTNDSLVFILLDVDDLIFTYHYQNDLKLPYSSLESAQKSQDHTIHVIYELPP